MTKHLQQYFPVLRSRKDVLASIESQPDLKSIYQGWPEKYQEMFLDIMSGERGIPMLYDFAAREALNPESTPERLEEILFLLLERKVKILAVLPNDSVRIAEERSLMVTDIVVELEDGTIANVEIQKLGYLFPGQRAASYSADLVMRQYKRAKSRAKRKFVYRMMRDVYTIVIFEDSPEPFRSYTASYLHCFEQKSDTGVKFSLLQKYIFISLDIFKETMHNRSIETKLEAWLAFLIMDEPEQIVSLLEAYPEFKPIYEQVYEQLRNIGGAMGVFSEELRIMDRNTVELEIEERVEERVEEIAKARVEEIAEARAEEIAEAKAKKRTEELKEKMKEEFEGALNLKNIKILHLQEQLRQYQERYGIL